MSDVSDLNKSVRLKAVEDLLGVDHVFDVAGDQLSVYSKDPARRLNLTSFIVSVEVEEDRENEVIVVLSLSGCSVYLYSSEKGISAHLHGHRRWDSTTVPFNVEIELY